MKMLSKGMRRRPFANDVQAFDPQFWANESLAVFEESMVIGGLVHRDFEPIIAKYGDTVNTRKVSEFTAVRKGPNDNVTVQNAIATNVAVKLNHHVHTSFLIRDGEESLSITSLVNEFIRPAMRSEARYADTVLLGQVYRYLTNTVGRLGNLTSSDVVDRITALREVMNNNKLPEDQRNLMLTSRTETQFLRNRDFVNAHYIGDDGTALRTAHLGRLFGFEHFTAINAPNVSTGSTTTAGAINNAAGYAVGVTTITVDGFSGTVVDGGWFTIAGDDSPQRIVSHTNTLGVTTAIVFTPGLRAAVLDNAVITAYTPGLVNNVANYPAGTYQDIAVDGFTVAPKKGQLITFGAAADVYSVLAATTTAITLDRPLDAAISDEDVVGVGPAGQYNLGFIKEALALVVRPLAAPRAGTGALASVVNHNNLSMRAVITYDGNKQGHLVTLDMLMGYQVLDVTCGAVLLG